MSKLNIALIGAGRRGVGAHLPVIVRMSDVYNLVAICDMNEETAEGAAKEYVNAYTNVRDLVKNEKIDVADINLPSDGHHAVACFLAGEGIHMLCETPIAITLPLADLMMEAAEKNNVKLEIAENYYRAPVERFKSKLIEAGVIGDVSRIYRIFYEGGYHGMSLLRVRAGGAPVSVLGISQESEIVPITDRMKRRHTSERWTMGIIDFDNRVVAVMAYSNVIHARALGRGQAGISQIDGSEGTIVGDDVHVVPPEDLEKGARGIAYSPRRRTVEVDGVQVLEKIEVELPDETVTWENPFKHYRLSEGQVAIADELWSIAQAVIHDKEPEYGAVRGRQDQEMNIGMLESALRGRQEYGRLGGLILGKYPHPKHFKIDSEEIRKAGNYLNRIICRHKGKSPRVKIARSFCLDEEMYRLFTKGNRQYLSVMGLERGRRVMIPLRGNTVIRGR